MGRSFRHYSKWNKLYLKGKLLNDCFHELPGVKSPRDRKWFPAIRARRKWVVYDLLCIVSTWDDVNTLDMDSEDGCAIAQIHFISPNYTLKLASMANFMLHTFCHNKKINGLALGYSRLSYCLQCKHQIGMLVWVLSAPVLVKLPGSAPGKEVEDGPARCPRLQASTWPHPGCFSHLEWNRQMKDLSTSLTLSFR